MGHVWLNFAIVAAFFSLIPLLVHVVLRYRRRVITASTMPCVRALEKADDLMKRANEVSEHVADHCR